MHPFDRDSVLALARRNRGTTPLEMCLATPTLTRRTAESRLAAMRREGLVFLAGHGARARWFAMDQKHESVVYLAERAEMRRHRDKESRRRASAAVYARRKAAAEVEAREPRDSREGRMKQVRGLAAEAPRVQVAAPASVFHWAGVQA